MLNGGGRYQSGGCAVSSEAMVCVVAKADRPPRLERIDLATGERQVLFDPNAALAADMGKTTPSRLLRWTDAKGQEFRSAERRVGKEGVMTCRSRWSPDH